MTSLYIIGDSHVEVFKYAEKNNLSKEIDILGSCMAPGRTAQGLNKIENRKIFINRAKSDFKGNADYIALQFGEIDCGYTLWSRMDIHNTNKKTEIEFAIKGITLLANDIKRYATKNVIFLGPIIPLISKYNNNIPESISKRKTVNADHKERTELVLWFCKEMKKEVKRLGYIYTDINKQLLDPVTQLVKSNYKDKKSLHHLGAAVGAHLWINNLTATINRQGN